MKHLHLTGCVAVAASLVAAASAQAATLGLSGSAPNTLLYRAALGETNALTVNQAVISGAPTTTFTDAVTILLTDLACTSTSSNSASCVGPQYNVDAHLRDGDDTATLHMSSHANVWGGPGDDTISADSFAQATAVYGDGGDDTIASGGEGGQIADGGGGDDVLHLGGNGQAAANGDGGRDVIFYNVQLAGRGTLAGGDGPDTIVAQPSGLNGSTASGGDGDDVIVIHGAPPPLATQGSYTVSGGAGDDTLVGGAYADTIDGGVGRDFVDVLGGGNDTVSCGPGYDIVRYDAGDTIAADCEITLGP